MLENRLVRHNGDEMLRKGFREKLLKLLKINPSSQSEHGESERRRIARRRVAGYTNNLPFFVSKLLIWNE